jgi:hypothetical protein
MRDETVETPFFCRIFDRIQEITFDKKIIEYSPWELSIENEVKSLWLVLLRPLRSENRLFSLRFELFHFASFSLPSVTPNYRVVVDALNDALPHCRRRGIVGTSVIVRRSRWTAARDV